MKLYYFLFYQLYRVAESSSWESNPQISAFLLITLIFTLDMMFGMACLEPVIGIRLELPHLSRLQTMFEVLIFSIPHYFLTLYKHRYREIISWAESQPHQERFTKTVMAVICISLPPVTFFVLVTLGVIRRT